MIVTCVKSMYINIFSLVAQYVLVLGLFVKFSFLIIKLKNRIANEEFPAFPSSVIESGQTRTFRGQIYHIFKK